ncbi:hypothetical protein [uncultured Gemmiger sp.]|uniref:hypothetical protein n=1 Tax=uncultured Gemmiger sp. TaxID=1623490 RepID=UPI0025F434BB|nr:hypothetical protein [uncultured Gemmiger sp.]
MMKKKTALVLTLAMVFSLAPLSAYADTIDRVGGTASHDVTATYKADSSGGAGGAGSTVYSVDITWGDMAFTYKAEAGTWDPKTHSFTGADGGAWTVDKEGGNKIKVTNHSNAEITASIAYTPAPGYDSISGSFDKTSLVLATAVDTEVSNAPNDSAALTLTGALDSKTAANTKIGTITVTLN